MTLSYDHFITLLLRCQPILLLAVGLTTTTTIRPTTTAACVLLQPVVAVAPADIVQ